MPCGYLTTNIRLDMFSDVSFGCHAWELAGPGAAGFEPRYVCHLPPMCQCACTHLCRVAAGDDDRGLDALVPRCLRGVSHQHVGGLNALRVSHGVRREP